jgi:tRNA (guanine37-N1)-methyltransferase
MRFDILTLFPEMFSGLNSSIIKRALEKDIIEINIHNFRKFSLDKNKRVDDYSYGGGAGMIIGLQAILAIIVSKRISGKHYHLCDA